MSRCIHCGGDNHSTNQCPDMPPPVTGAPAQPSMERGAAQDLARLMQSLGYVEFAYCLSFDAYNLIVTALETAHPPADTVEPTDLPDGWEYQKDTNSVVCGGCAFRYGAEHSDADGNWTCPNCGNGNGAAQRPAATVETFERPGWCPACSCTVECALDHSSAGNVEVPTDALINLVNYQEQCDEDGVMVKVSRQALAEVLVYVQLVRPDLNALPQGARK